MLRITILIFSQCEMVCWALGVVSIKKDIFLLIYLLAPISFIFVTTTDNMNGFLEEPCGTWGRWNPSLLQQSRCKKDWRLSESFLKVLLWHRKWLLIIIAWKCNEKRMREWENEIDIERGTQQCNCIIQEVTIKWIAASTTRLQSQLYNNWTRAIVLWP